MHTLTVRTRFAAGDRVHVEPTMWRSYGSGTIAFFTIDKDSRIGYAIKFDQGHDHVVGGVPEVDIALLERRSADNLVTIRTKFTFGDRVRFVPSWHRRGGTGTISHICVEGTGHYYIDYGIALESRDGDEQHGVVENEITLLNDGGGGG